MAAEHVKIRMQAMQAWRNASSAAVKEGSFPIGCPASIYLRNL